MLNVPFVLYDCSRLTETGYVGPEVDDILRLLARASNHGLKEAAKGIVFLDEFDKLAANRSDHHHVRDVGGYSVQQELLKVIEGSEVALCVDHRRGNGVGIFGPSIDTKDVLFICGGVFQGLDRIRAKRLGASRLGFQKPGLLDTTLPPPTADDLIEFGFLPELVGRLPLFVELDMLDLGALRRILVEPKNSIVSQYQTLFEMDGIPLHFTPNALDAIALQAFESGCGARSLRPIIESLLLDHQFHAGSTTRPKEIVVDIVAGHLAVHAIPRPRRGRPRKTRPAEESLHASEANADPGRRHALAEHASK